MISGGDQIYADLVWDVVRPVRSWLEERFDVFEDWEREEFTDEMRAAVEDFYFDLYRQRWGQPEIAPVLSQVPSMMMWDDHDIFDGWGSHPKNSRVARSSREYSNRRANILCFSSCNLTPRSCRRRRCPDKEASATPTIGELAVAVLDMRSERTQQVMSLEAWNALRDWMHEELDGCRHLLLVSSIPVVYVNATLVETVFGIVPGSQGLEDDFKDQWLSRSHQEERLRLIHRLLDFSRESRCRVTIVSGDVHWRPQAIYNRRGGIPHTRKRTWSTSSSPRV